jgi:hypothetical protein
MDVLEHGLGRLGGGDGDADLFAGGECFDPVFALRGFNACGFNLPLPNFKRCCNVSAS